MGETGHDLVYGLDGSIEGARIHIEAVLGKTFAPHSSTHHGGDYYRLEFDENEIILQRNYDCVDDCPAEPEHPMYPTLVYLSGPDSILQIAAQIDREIAGIVMLRRHSRRRP